MLPAYIKLTNGPAQRAILAAKSTSVQANQA
jgi:hypothetical protein